MNYPQYRKYKNDLSYFKVVSAERFIEWKKQPSSWEEIKFEAKILPDRVFISDMLADNSKYWDVITELEYVDFLEKKK